MQRILENNNHTINKANFKSLYDTYSAKMFSICMRLLGNRQDAEDILQEGFIKIFNSIDTFEGKGSFEGWMKRIFANTCINFLKANKNISNTETIDQTIEANYNYHATDITISNIEYKDIFKLLNQIPDLSRLIFILHSIEGYSLAELAEIFNLKESACRCRYMRTRNKVLKLLITANNFNSETQVQYA